MEKENLKEYYDKLQDEDFLCKEIKEGRAINLEQILARGGMISLKDKNWLEEYRGTTIEVDTLTDEESKEKAQKAVTNLFNKMKGDHPEVAAAMKLYCSDYINDDDIDDINDDDDINKKE